VTTTSPGRAAGERQPLRAPSADRAAASRTVQGMPAEQAVNRDTVASPDALDWYLDFANRFRATYQTKGKS
jgi:hypothetical protein